MKGKCCLLNTSLLTFYTTCHDFAFHCHPTLLRHLVITLQLHVVSPLRSGCFIALLSALRFLRRKGIAQGVTHYSHCALCQLPQGITLLVIQNLRAGTSEGKKCFPRVKAVGTYSYFGNRPLRQQRPSNFFQLKNLLEISNKSNPLFSGKTSLDNHVESGSSKENQDVHHRWLQPRWR